MSNEQTSLEVQHGAQLSLNSQAPIAKLLETVINNGLTEQSVGVVERLVGLYERMQEKDAEKQFAAAFVALQLDLPTIVASTIIPNRGKYEKFEDVMRVLQPLLTKHGFSVSFSMDFKDNRILETCHLRHVGGHSQSNSFAVRSGKADSDTQADCKAATTAKRNALLNCFNIVVRQDVFHGEDDVSLEGEFISHDKAQYLREEVVRTGSCEAAFLKFAGASKYEEIGSTKYPMLARALAKRPTK